MPETVGIVGAGLVGCLTALAFSKKGYKVKVYESRPDIRTPEQIALSSFRSINLAVAKRGILALESVDKEMADRVLEEGTPMYGRMIHDLEGNETSQKYGLYGEANYAIDRAKLNRKLLDELEKEKSIELNFEHKLESADFDKMELVFSCSGDSNENKKTKVQDLDRVIGADGSYSKTRQQLQRVVRMDYSQKYIDHLYLELSIPPGPGGKFLLDPNHLHIWPRHEYMLIAIANSDGSFTSTLFAPQTLFDTLDTDAAILKFFEEQFKDALGLIGVDSLLDSFHKNPRGALISVKCNPYHYKDRAIIIGDAAHSMVPFYGQGMNCGFEDVRVLMEILEESEKDFGSAFELYTARRHKDLTAIIELAMNNYVEMRHSVTSRLYLMRKSLDGFLSRLLKDRWLPLYSMVSFRPDIPYSAAVATEARQKAILNSVITNTGRLVGAAGIVGVVLAVKQRYRM